MKPLFTLTQTNIVAREVKASLEEMAAEAQKMEPECWLMVETPREFVGPIRWEGNLTLENLREAAALVIFGSRAELRIEKPGGATTGWLRLLRQDKEGEPVQTRKLSALLRDKTGGKLLFEEYFRPDSNSGFLLRKWLRLSGVEK